MKGRKQQVYRLAGIFLGLIILLGSYSFKNDRDRDTENNQPLKVIIAMLDSIKKIRSYQFELKALERVENGEYLTAESSVKLNMHPKALYFRNEKKKISVMYVAGANENKALVKAKALLNSTVSLDPYGSMMRKNQHYTIHELGFDYFAHTITFALLKDKMHISQNLKFIGKKTISAKPCIGLVFEDPDFHYIDYVTRKKETVASLASKFNVSEYQIRLKNGLDGFYGTMKEGKQLKIPSNYCKRINIYIDEATLLPVTITIYDEAGLYESYEYLNVKTNLKFTSDDFGKFYKD
ncbi:MAG: hypothetical protein K0S33_710 [Bacteroidetes bacterium]|jgi:hypothetical protein|nr:hypothetical protein [Bacteroidota bacterium]